MNEFRYTGYAQEIIFGVSALDKLGEVAERYGFNRMLLVTTGSQRRNGHADQVESALGSRLVSVYSGVQPHVPDFQVANALKLARGSEIDAIVGMGGGSAIGMAKAVSFAFEEETGSSPLDRPREPVIAIPTTYAGSEMTPVYGVTAHEGDTSRKVTVSDPRIAPRVAIYDPLLTLDLPPEMTASTGINALAHCLEALYSITRNPISTAVALEGIKAIMASLQSCHDNNMDLEARTTMLSGAMLAGMALAHVKMGLHHGLCHVLGGSAGVPHGIANAIMLPHALAFNLDVTIAQLARATGAMGIPTAGQSDEAKAKEAIDRVSTLIAALKLPRRLRDVNVPREDLPRLADLALQSSAVKNNPKTVASAEQTLEIFEAAW
jgi:alcohol dehydrogenase class IV